MKKNGTVRTFRNITLIISALLSNTPFAQVANNNIIDRTELVIEAAPLHSSTANASVEWECVNKALTNKCLVYHNDQWFHFTPNDNGRYFLNISSQQCRDLRGVQLLVIEGNPCEVSTYRIINCIPQIHQEDVFVELDSLQAGMQYLVNVDGFLGDFCEFNIQFSKTPAGFPRIMQSQKILDMKTVLQDSLVTIHWQVNKLLIEDIRYFKVFRSASTDKKSTLVGEQNIQANALGTFIEKYSITDVLRERGAYTYRIMGIRKENEYPVLLDEQKIHYKTPVAKQEHPKWIYIPLSLKNGSPYLVLVFNRADYTLLRKYSGAFDEAKDSTFEINLAEFVTSGVKEFIVLASEPGSSQAKEFYYRVDGAGNVIGN